MDQTRLGELAEAYGADWRRWPEAEREAARALLATDLAAERLLFAERQLDAALDLAPRLEVSAALRERVVAAAVCAGLLVGEAMVVGISAGLQADSVLYLASLDAVDDTEILQ